MSISPQAKRNLGRILPFGLIWLLLGWYTLLTQEAATQSINVNPSVVISLTPAVFTFASIAVTLLGLTVGTLEVLWLGKLFKNNSFALKILYKVGFYAFFLLLVILILYPLAASVELNASPWDGWVLEKLSNFLFSIDFVSTMASIAFSLFASLFYAEISDNVGHGVMMNFFTGRYHQPIEEQRIFMFCDMKASTTIAEQLGHIRYFHLLRAYYAAFSEAIIRHSGEVYQYIGDEIVISWTYETGLRQHNCVRCFFAMKEALQQQTESFQQRFGVVPTFKAGLHVGSVTTGEIDALKKEIIFTGDVLNTTARIQGLCNAYGVDNLLSEDLVALLPPEKTFPLQSLGTAALKGRVEPMGVFTVGAEGPGRKPPG